MQVFLGVLLAIQASDTTPVQLRATQVETLVDGLDCGTGGLAVDGRGNVYSADFGWNLGGGGKGGDKVFKVTPAGEASIFCREMNGASGNALDAQGNLYQSSIRGGFVSRVAPDGKVSVFSRAGFKAPVGIVVDKQHIFVNNCGAGNIMKVTQDGKSSVFCDSKLLKCPNGITLANDDNFYVANFSNGDVVKVTRDGKASRLVTLPGNNNGHITFHKGMLYVVARTANQIYQVTLDGEAKPFVGCGKRGKTDGDPLASSLSLPNDLGFSPDGKYLYINETSPTKGDPRVLGPTRIRRVAVAESQENDVSRAVASVEDLKWIAGQWRGGAMGGSFEETWNLPLGDSMSGVFHFVKDGKTVFYEILTIVPDGNSVKLRLKHFGSDLVGWEEKEKSIEFPLKTLTEHEAAFDGLVFRRIKQNRMNIIVRTKEGEKVDTLLFECHRFVPAQAAIKRVYELDAVLAKQRDHLCEHEPLATSIRAYVLGLDNIDYSKCPDSFTAAYKKHRDAWNASIDFFEKHRKLRGEMHDLFDQIRKLGAAERQELETHNRAIMDTWKAVEVAAAATD